jgi:hypothetical protein
MNLCMRVIQLCIIHDDVGYSAFHWEAKKAYIPHVSEKGRKILSCQVSIMRKIFTLIFEHRKKFFDEEKVPRYLQWWQWWFFAKHFLFCKLQLGVFEAK